MKNYLIGGCICLLGILIIGIEPLQRAINDSMNRGTLKGAETCISYSSSELLSTETIRSTCVNAFQMPLFDHDHATGRAGPWMEPGVAGWEGILENKMPDFVTTWVQISVSIYDPGGVEQEYFAETSIWIDPQDEAEFRMKIPALKREQIEGIEFCENDNPAPKACMEWGVKRILGLSI
ncbi:hypothetical protein HW561_13715 [Rhodobacteraceae bacterium B1Z28]|uniref:Uncharacterized protein n=1 Tax=Ruegeria haliotis TaxID=2747601 RepID=A0ABX2PRT0_9RHOB|nr:hypothetical protein [Ruegeria haliotis]NVO56846.1 hypothetical protein [Ruegeria haliotis]